MPSLPSQHSVHTSWLSLLMVQHLMLLPIAHPLLPQQPQYGLYQTHPSHYRPPRPCPPNTRYQPSHQRYHLEMELRRHWPMPTWNRKPTPLYYSLWLKTLRPRKRQPPRILILRYSSWPSSLQGNKGIWRRCRRLLIIWWIYSYKPM